MFFLLQPAFALDCTGLNSSSCDAANQATSQANTALPGAYTEDHSKVRRRVSFVYDLFETVRQNADCESPEVSIVGTIGGRWSRGNNTFSGTYVGLSDGASGSQSGTIDPSTRSFLGTYTGTGSGDLGDTLSVYNDVGQLVGNRDEGFLAGGWVRTSGRRGSYVVVYGDCTGEVDQGFDDWFDGGLVSAPDPCAPVGDADGDSICDDVDPCIGVPLFEEDFEGIPQFELNTADTGGSTSPTNDWAINDVYTGGSGTLICLGFLFNFTVPHTPTQPAAITNSPTSNYLHPISDPAAANNIFTSTYLAADGICQLPETTFARMTTDIDTTGMQAVDFSFWWIGAGASTTFGEVYYSTNSGTSWTQLTNPIAQYNNQSSWTQQHITASELLGHPTLRFGFRMVNNLSQTGAEPPFSVDQIQVCALPE